MPQEKICTQGANMSTAVGELQNNLNRKKASISFLIRFAKKETDHAIFSLLLKARSSKNHTLKKIALVALNYGPSL